MANGTENSKDDGENTVVVVGGHGGKSNR